MMRRTLLPVLALCTVLGTAAAVAQAGSPGTARLEDLSWLAGSWAGEVRGAAPGTRFETHYTTPQGGVIPAEPSGDYFLPGSVGTPLGLGPTEPIIQA